MAYAADRYIGLRGLAVGRFGVHDGDDTVARLKAPFDMQRLPGIGCLVLGDAISVLAGMRVLAEIDLRRHRAAEIDECEAQPPADRSIGAPPRTEHAIAVIEAKLGYDRTVQMMSGAPAWVVVWRWASPYGFSRTADSAAAMTGR